MKNEQGSVVPFANIGILRSSDSSFVKGSLGTATGEFSLSVPDNEKYILKVFAIDFEDYFSEVSTSVDTIDLTVSMVPKRINLNEISVTVIKSTIEQKNGNFIVNIESSSLSNGYNAFELMSKLPGVIIDENNNILVNGQTGVRVMIDGRIQQLSGNQLVNFLRSLQSSNISKIEILKNPPSSIDASGGAGIIHIYTRKNKITGVSGNVNATASQGFYCNTDGGYSINYLGKKISLSHSLSLMKEKYHVNHRFDRKISFNDTVTELNSRTIELNGGNFFSAALGLDWTVNKRNIIGIRFSGDGGKGMPQNTGTVYASDNNLGYSRLNYIVTTPNPWYYLNFNINSEHLIDTNQSSIRVSFDYSPNYDLYDGRLENYFSDAGVSNVLPPLIMYNKNKLNFDIYSGKIDLVKKLKKDYTFEAGVKAAIQKMKSEITLDRMDNNSGYLIRDTVYSNVFEFRENTEAGYMALSKSLNKINLQVGLRGEYTSLYAHSITGKINYRTDYFKLFPNVNLEFSVNDNNQLNFNYNRRINRPNYNNFNPYKTYQNLLMSSTGNSYLIPDLINAFELSHSYKSSFSHALKYFWHQNYLTDVTIQNDSTKEVSAYFVNLTYGRMLVYSLFFNKDLFKWWHFSLNGWFAYREYKGVIFEKNYAAYGNGASVSLNNELVIKNTTRLELNAKYIYPGMIGVFNIQPRWGVFASVKQTFLKEKLSVLIGLEDIFFTMNGANRVKFQNQDWYIQATNDTRRIKISINYQFGSVKVDMREVISNEDEKSRIGK